MNLKTPTVEHEAVTVKRKDGHSKREDGHRASANADAAPPGWIQFG